MKSPKKLVSEMWANFDVSRSSWFGPNISVLRGMFSDAFFKRPLMDGTVVNYDLARALYRNDTNDWQLGAGFVRPIIDLTTEYMGIPSVSGTPDDAFLNECITDYWKPQLQEMMRDCQRDSKVYIRYRQPNLLNPLVTEKDRTRGKIEVLPPESVELSFMPDDPDMVERAVLTHFIDFDARSEEEILAGTAPRLETHELLEIITPAKYTWFDKTSAEELSSWSMQNKWKFVPIWPAYNDYASDLGGGQSDIEPILPFIQAFHEVLNDTLAAHKYHSIPKAKFNVKNVENFMKNNWPTLFDETTGKLKAGAKVEWKGKEIMFFEPEEDGGFIEAQSVLGDSKTLLDFLLDCICVAAETPRWALLVEEKATPETDASVQPFIKKIERKRTTFQDVIVIICKMCLAANKKIPNTPRVAWPEVRLTDLVTKGQAIQQLIMGFDVATAHEWIADETVTRILATLFDEIGDPEAERQKAKANVVPEIPAPAPQSDTQPASSNGKVKKSTAKRALATTSASNS